MAIHSFETVRELGLGFPGVVAATAYGALVLKLDGRLVACVPRNKSAEADSLMVRIDTEHRAELIRQQPGTYYLTDHYVSHPTVLVRLSKISRADLKALLGDACRFVSRSATIDDYLKRVPAPRRRALVELRARIREIVPEAQECISYRIPAFRLEGKVVAGFAATASGGSYYPFSGRTLKTLAKDLKAFGQTKGAVHFSESQPLSTALLRKLIRARIKEIRSGPEPT
ncbi:MAG TPA: DUF1801 domain-containing protein [Steroidobacteraceae bacterium]|nr:DUF1801 domain-containing protein [Steroidobacteraceae bacterium]